MKLYVHTAGDGPRTALLIHGAMADHGTWHAVTDTLVRRGYRVLAPDLRGHGRSPRGAYSPELLAEDLRENLPPGTDVAIGHSLGGLVLSLAVADLAPKRAIYSDPAFGLPEVPAQARAIMVALADQATPANLRKMNPRWSDADIRAELEGFSRFDRAVVGMLANLGDRVPAEAVVPSLVQLAEESVTVPPEAAERLRANGFEVRIVAGAGHCVHRDDFGGFMSSLDGWI